ncbi:hypothetical protein [Pseudomonas sp. GD03944]|uniref:hypothetical protein n=1 Tax=Pseudomonas sp. GD03944 TaxID=2975409 RepID=UPI00244D2305|nr:hypothetical protein [Pseudomonas sp. GD03944]MDH1261955.1 hypothetical protein [Pseudomonas sp. GD03944]
MSFKSMLFAVLGLSMTGCAVYGDSYERDYYRSYDRGYYSGGSQVQRHPVYVEPRFNSYHDRRYDRYRDDRRYYDNRPYYDQRRYAPPPPPRYYNDRRYERRDDHRRHDYRSAQPRPGWNGRHYQPRERTPNNVPRGLINSSPQHRYHR